MTLLLFIGLSGSCVNPATGTGDSPRRNVVSLDPARNKPPPDLKPSGTSPELKPLPPPAEPSGEKAAVPQPTFPEAGALPEKYALLFQAVRSDPPPPKIVHDTHYFISNEGAHHVWREALENLGGALAGPGTDQLYILAAWQKPSVLFALDFDETIQYVHRLYGLAFAHARTPDEFISLWKYGRTKPSRIKALISSEIVDPALRKKLVLVLEKCNSDVLQRFRIVKEYYRTLKQTCYLTDLEQYNTVRNLWLWGRVFPIRGDLTAEVTMQDLARALDKAGVPLRALYLSNAEQYFKYTPTYRRNIVVQPFDDRSIVLRTQSHTRDVIRDGNGYRFNLQGGKNFARWLRLSNVVDVKELMEKRTRAATPGISVLDQEPPTNAKPPRIAPVGDGYAFPGRHPI